MTRWHALVVLVATVASADNLLSNGDFEAVGDDGVSPVGWHAADFSPAEQRAPIRAVSSTTEPAGGQRAVQLLSTNVGGNLVLFQDVARLAPGNYVLTVQTRPAAGRSASASLVTMQAGRNLLYENSARVTGDGQWHALTVSVDVGPLADRVRVILRANGEAAFDEALLMLNPDREPSTAAELEARRAAELEAEAKTADEARKARMSPPELAWELLLERCLGDFYLPRYKAEKLAGRVSAWDYVADDPALPRALLIGDSISRGYTLAVRQALAGRVNLHRAPENCGPTTNGLAKLDLWLGEGKWDLIHFNFGIHDRNSSSEDYAARLTEITRRLQATGAKLIFATSTPLPPDSEVYRQGECARLNVAANEVMATLGVPINDLYTAVLPHLARYQNPGDCHFNEEGYTFLGGLVAERIRQALE